MGRVFPSPTVPWLASGTMRQWILRLEWVAPDGVVKKGCSEGDAQGEKLPARQSGGNSIPGGRKQPMQTQLWLKDREKAKLLESGE